MSPRTLKQLLFVGLLAGLALVGLVALPARAAPPVLVVWGTPGTGDGEFDNPAGVAVTGGGAYTTVYVADSYNHRIQKFTVDGVAATFVISWGAIGTGQGEFNTPSAVAVDGGGNVYVADTNNHRIQMFDAGGGFQDEWGALGVGKGEFDSPSGIAIGAGYIYVADSKNNRIQAFDLATRDYAFEWGSGGGGNGEFNNPVGVAMDSAGNVYVADSDNNRIQAFDGAGGFLTTWGVTGTLLGQFTRPTGVAVDSSNNVYVVDSGNNRVQVFTSGGGLVTAWGDFGTGNGQFMLVSGIAVDSAGNSYVADTGNSRIQEFGALSSAPLPSPTPSALTFMGEWGQAGSGSGEFNAPTDVALDSAGNLYVVDAGNNRIQKFDGSGKYLTAWDGSLTPDGQFSNPSGIAISGTNVYVADYGNNLIREFDLNGAVITSWTSPMLNPTAIAVGYGDTTYTAGGVPPVPPYVHVVARDSGGTIVANWEHSFYSISDIALNTAGQVFVTDAGNNGLRVQEFKPTGEFVADFGSTGSGSMIAPASLSIDRSGNIYVADRGNVDTHGRIQQFGSDNGYLFTIDDSALAGYTTPATFGGPRGVAVTADGSALYVADTDNNRIVKFGLAAPPTYVRSFGEYGSGDGQFNKPGGIAVDNPLNSLSAARTGVQSTNYVYVADTLNRRVQKFTTGGSYVWQWTYWMPHYPGPSDQFMGPAGVAYSPIVKWVYVTDAILNRVDAFDPSGNTTMSPDFFKREWGGPGSGNGELWHPVGVAVDKNGFVYVADTGNDRIEKFDFFGMYQTKYGPNLAKSTWCPALTLRRPSGIAVDGSGFIYISDTGHNRIVKLNSSGVCVNHWGTSGISSCPAREFDGPSGLTVGGGFLTVADTANSRLMKYTTDGLCLGKVGTPGSAPGQFNKVTGLATDGEGNIFASDTNNNVVEVFEDLWLVRTPLIMRNFH